MADEDRWQILLIISLSASHSSLFAQINIPLGTIDAFVVRMKAIAEGSSDIYIEIVEFQSEGYDFILGDHLHKSITVTYIAPPPPTVPKTTETEDTIDETSKPGLFPSLDLPIEFKPVLIAFVSIVMIRKIINKKRR